MRHDDTVLVGFALVAGGSMLIVVGLTVVARREALGGLVDRMKRDYRWFVGEPGAVALFGIATSLIGAGWVVSGIVALVRGG